jgi:U4/U6 small nuclear ribonucleoprotein PRP31
MSTLADELLQDFEDSGSEGEEQQNGGLFPDNEETKLPGHNHATSDSMELDGDEEDVQDDEEMAGVNDAAKDVEDEEETKAKIEKMQLGGVNDVRSVAGLMKSLEPVLEVSTSCFYLSLC